MIRVTFFKSIDEINNGLDYYVDTLSFIEADTVAVNKTEEMGVDLKKYPQKALSLIDVLKV